MKKILSILIVGILSVTAFSSQASAQRGAKLSKETRRALLDSLTPEQKKALRENMRAKYDSLSPAQKEKIKDQIKSRLDSLPPKERKELRQELLRNRKKGNG
jgi:DNA-binding MarR family transcriptional regulator